MLLNGRGLLLDVYVVIVIRGSVHMDVTLANRNVAFLSCTCWPNGGRACVRGKGEGTRTCS